MNMRPSKFDEVIGQEDVIKRLRITAEGSLKNGAVLPHILLDGPPGLGKTTIANAIASEVQKPIHTTNAASIRSVKSILPYLFRISHGGILFIDEIHALPKLVEEFLYPIMEDFVINIVLDDKPEEVHISHFTLIGATTSGGSLSQPFYDRFTIKEHLSFYTDDALAKLARLNADKLGLKLSESELLEIASRSKGTPRILNARLQWCKNYMACNENSTINISSIFDSQGIDKNGLDEYDRQYLDVLKKHRGTPLGIRSLSSITGIASDTIENSIEPYLVRKGFVRRTQKGRVIGEI